MSPGDENSGADSKKAAPLRGRLPKAGSEAAPPPKLGYRVLWRRCLDASRGEVVSFVEGWFYDVRYTTLTEGDVREWISGNVFGCLPADLSETRDRQLGWMVTLLERRLAVETRQPLFAFPPGNSSTPYMAAPQQPLDRALHPLLLYAVVGASRRAYGLQLKASGFRKQRAGRLTYWHKPGNGTTTPGDRTALVFAHGIGVGLLPYRTVIKRLSAGAGDTGAAVYLLELPAISTTLGGDDLPTARELAMDASSALDANGDSRAVWVGHSFGSAAMAYVLKHATQKVAALVFVEPVVFLLNRPNVSNGFLYNAAPDPILDVLRTDPGISFAMRRRFWWQEAMLFAEDVDVPCDVFLADNDAIVPSEAVARYLTAQADPNLVNTYSFGPMTHGEWQYDDVQLHRVVAAALDKRDAADADAATKPPTVRDYLDTLIMAKPAAPGAGAAT